MKSLFEILRILGLASHQANTVQTQIPAFHFKAVSQTTCQLAWVCGHTKSKIMLTRAMAYRGWCIEPEAGGECPPLV